MITWWSSYTQLYSYLEFSHAPTEAPGMTPDDTWTIDLNLTQTGDSSQLQLHLSIKYWIILPLSNFDIDSDIGIKFTKNRKLHLFP